MITKMEMAFSAEEDAIEKRTDIHRTVREIVSDLRALLARRRQALLVLSAFLCTLSLSAQDFLRLSGTVTGANGEGIPYATVAVPKEQRGTHTDADGRYTLELPAGSYTVEASSVGYGSVSKRVEGRGARKIDFVLQESAVALGEVQVFGQNEAGLKSLGGYSVTSLDVRSVAPSARSLTGVLQRMSGVKLRETGGVGSDFNLVLNGLSGSAVRYFIDGMPLEAAGKGFTLSNLPLNLIDRIDVYKGVVPSELAQDALGGAVNIITKRSGRSYLDASISYGSFRTLKAELSGQYLFPRSGVMVRPTVSFTSSKNNYLMKGVELWDEAAYEYRTFDMPRFHDGYRSLLGQIEVGVTDKSWADEAFVTLSGATSHKEIQTGEKQTIVVGEGTRDVTSLGATLKYTKRNLFVPGLRAKLFASYAANKTLVTDTAYKAYAWDGSWVPSSFTEVTGRERSIRHYDRPQVTVRANLDYAVGRSGSLDFNYLFSHTNNHRYDDYDEEFVPTDDVMDKHVFALSYRHSFMEDRLTGTVFLKDYLFHAKLEQQDHEFITGFLGLDPESTKNHSGYGATLRYTLFEPLSLKASFEKSVRLPAAHEFLGNGLTVWPNFRLRPEQAHNFNLGLYGDAGFGHGNHTLSYELTAFGRLVTDYIMRQITGDRESQYVNIAATNVYGIEGEISYSYCDVWHAVLNATYLDERNQTRINVRGMEDPTFGNRLPNRPYLFANLMLSWTNRDPFGLRGHRILLGYTLNYVHDYYLNWEAYGSKDTKAVIPEQYPQNLTASWYFPGDRISLTLECDNLLDQTVYDNYMLQKPGRSFFAKLRFFLE